MARRRGKPAGRTKRPPRELRKRILVVTEGTKTEPQYVEGLESHLRSTGSTAIVKSCGVGADPLKVVQRCVAERDKVAGSETAFDTCVCLVDVDQHASLHAACELAICESILLLVSNLKFEVWLRWHVEDKRPALSSRQLDEHCAKLNLLTDKRISPRFPYENVFAACECARLADSAMKAGRVGPDPSSALPILVELMRE